MPTAASTLLAPDPRLPWRGLALLTAAVVVAHLALLALAPTSVGPRPSPLASKFITRTIVIAPPAAEPAPSAAPAPTAPQAKSPPKPVRPRPAARPRPAPVATPSPEAKVSAPSEPASQDLIAQAAIDAGAAEPPTPAASAAATATGPGSSSAEGNGTAAAGGDASGNMAGTVPLRISGSVRLAFAATGQQGAQPLEGVFGDLVWLQDGQNYDARLSLTFLFRTLRTQHSAGVIGPTGIEPARFSETRKTEVASHFVRDQGTVVFSTNAPTVRLLAGAQDRLSVVLQLGALLAGDPARYPPGAIIAVQTVGPRDADIWTFKVEEDERLSVPAGEFAVRKLTRNPRKPFDDKVELWVAPELGYLPVRIKQTQTNGDFADLQLRELVPLRGPN